MEKIVAQALELLEKVTYHNYEWSNERGDTRRLAGILEVDALSMINVQFDQLTKRLDKMQATEALSQMSSYAKFLKEILLKKRRLEDYETVALIEECGAILQNKLPLKLKDPYPIGILEKISIKVEKFFIPVDFVVLEMEEDVQIPIILGRPFLATAKAIIDVKNGRLTLKVRDEEVELNLFRAIKHKLKPNECLRVDIIDKLVDEEFHKKHPEDPFEACIMHSHTADNENTEIAACARSLAASPSLTLAQALQVEELKEEQPKSRVLPPNMSYQQRKKFLYDVRFYTWEELLLYKRCNDGLIRRCTPEEDVENILQHYHSSS
ncbi:uncharacterized protein LOC131183153 [Hevea brasiliensis]|uniref:uncharacterized protein LOC131183153 n=1 Tax=Hevea brasiliensis TaxID=3981 RepID=UPI0025D6719A|nr:uncharacterized protein LOC131183153 [Hevea brasiliensis]